MNTKETLLAVEGMTCGACVHHVHEALGGLEGVAEVGVRLREGQVLVRHDVRAVPVEKLVTALRTAGYAASALS